MKFPFFLPVLLTIHISSPGQATSLDSIARRGNPDMVRIERTLSADQILAPLGYLASDKLMGRHIGLSEIDTAVQFIADQFKAAGANPVNGAKGYFQIFRHSFERFSVQFRYDPQVAADFHWPAASINGVVLKNVLAVIRGTDTLLRDQYIVVSSHYDHEGVADSAIWEEGKMDSIFNGARDNATGTAAVIAAAKYFAKYPPRRSILFICYTAEEEGLIGSGFYADHPLIPLNQTVFNLNVDNASYNTTRAVCLFGLDLTSEDSLIRAAADAYQFEVLDAPAHIDLFQSSDNYSLAKKGIPAPTYSMGITRWDKTILNRYHRLSDEVGNMDLDYVVKFIRTYILAVQYIANDPRQPTWAPGEEYEKDWKLLFDKK